MSLSRRRPRPKFTKGTTVKDRVEILLQERGIPYSSKSLKVVRFGARGCLYSIVVEDQIVGEYDHLHHEIHLSALHQCD